jgi:hypothetical protein
MSDSQALEQIFAAYLPNAVYAAPAVLVKHLKLADALLRAGLERLVESGRAARAPLAGYKGDCYVWLAREGEDGRAAA